MRVRTRKCNSLNGEPVHCGKFWHISAWLLNLHSSVWSPSCGKDRSQSGTEDRQAERLIVVRWLFHRVLDALIVRHLFRRHILYKDSEDLRYLPSPMLHVAIREREITCLIVPARRKVPPDILHEIGRISWW